ncbi:pC84L [African swine fever virus]|uniref:PC84L n=1 Tax=African swine fever virus TaxID=10497 RepID=A0A8A1UFW7_ASF|nr:pC84L [African swine fever virus]
MIYVYAEEERWLSNSDCIHVHRTVFFASGLYRIPYYTSSFVSVGSFSHSGYKTGFLFFWSFFAVCCILREYTLSKSCSCSIYILNIKKK